MSELDLGILIERVADGDEYAFATLYDATSPLVYGLALRMLGDTRVAEEVVREAYGRAWECACEYSRDDCAPLTWLLMMARDGALRRLRLVGGSTRDDAPSGDNDGGRTMPTGRPECVSEVSKRRGDAPSTLGALSHDEWQALESAFFSVMTLDDIAKHLNRPICEIKTHLRQGLKKLREMISSREGG